MVKVLVVGAGGGLGLSVGARAEGTMEVIRLDRTALDVTVRADVFERVSADRPDAIIYASGFNDVEACESAQWRADGVNRGGADFVSRAAAEVGALVVYPGCDLVFDGMQDRPYREEDAPNPLSVYGETRLAGELAVMRQAPRHLILRTGWLFGPYGRNLVRTIVENLDGEEGIRGADYQRGGPTSQLEFAGAMLELIRQGATGLWHVTSPGEGTEVDVARETCAAVGRPDARVRPLRRREGGLRALRPRHSVLDCSKAKGAGINLSPWRDALRAFVASCRAGH